MIYKKITCTIYFVLILTIGLCQKQKRTAPHVAKPIIINSIEYSTPQMGYIVAKNSKTDSVIWKKRIYKVDYIKGLETDVQDIFISSITYANNFLVIADEKRRVYKLDLKSLEVTHVK